MQHAAQSALSDQARRLLLVMACVYVGDQGSRFLLNIFTFKVGGSLSATVWFNVANVTGGLLGAWAGAHIMHRFGRRASLTAASLGLPLAFLFVVLWPGDSLPWITLGGLMYGALLGMAYTGQNTILYETAKEGNRDRLNSMDTAIYFGTVTIVAPLMGVLATVAGYTPVFAVVLACFGALPFLVRRLPNTRFEQSLKSALVFTPPPSLRRVFGAFVGFGAYNGFYALLSSVLAYTLTRQEAAAGLFSFLFGVGSVCTYLVLKRWATPATRPRFFTGAAILLPFVFALLLLPFSVLSVYTFAILAGLLVPVWVTMLNSTGQQVAEQDPVYRGHSVEYTLGRQLAIMGGSLLPFIYLLSGGVQSVEAPAFKAVVLALLFAPPACLVLARSAFRVADGKSWPGQDL